MLASRSWNGREGRQVHRGRLVVRRRRSWNNSRNLNQNEIRKRRRTVWPVFLPAFGPGAMSPGLIALIRSGIEAARGIRMLPYSTDNDGQNDQRCDRFGTKSAAFDYVTLKYVANARSIVPVTEPSTLDREPDISESSHRSSNIFLRLLPSRRIAPE